MNYSVDITVPPNSNVSKRKRTMTISAEETIATTSNTDFARNFIAYFEGKIEENKENEKYLSDAPNYYAWLRLSSEYVTQLIKEMIYINNRAPEAYDYSYMKLLDTLISDGNLDEEQKENIILFAEIRHVMVHKGFPNPHATPSNNEKPIIKGYVLTNSRVKDVAYLIREPSSYFGLKNKFTSAINAVLSVTEELDHDFGWIQIRNRKC